MSHAKILELAPRSAEKPALAPGLHPARLEAKDGERFRARILGGSTVIAIPGDDVESAFLDECLAEGRTVLISPSPDGPTILGALQSKRAVARDAHDTVRVEGRRVEIEAEDGVSIRVGKSAVRLGPNGDVRVVGQKMTMDVAEVVRILAALCELP